MVKGSFRCRHCSQVFGYRTNLRSHIFRVHSTDRPYHCNKCPKTFRSNTELRIHFNSHLGIKPFKCHLCPKAFYQSAHLKSHLRTHTGEKPFKCPLCPKSFTQSSHLRTHQSHHTGDKPHKCPTCGDAFRLPSTLKCHLRRHTGEKPYKCHLCGARFSQTTPLYHHLQKHTGEEIWKCERCGKTFGLKVSLKNHLSSCLYGGGGNSRGGKRRRPFQCVFCKGRWYTQEQLYRDLRRHIGEQPFFCRFCDLSFIDAEARRYHMRIHSEDGHTRDKKKKRWQCDKCQHSFEQQWRLERHVNLNHREVETDKTASQVEEELGKDEGKSSNSKWKCEHCFKAFENEGQLKNHKRDDHLIGKPRKKNSPVELVTRRKIPGETILWGQIRRWQCKECGERFVDEFGVTLHLKLVHEGLIPWKCKYCWKTFPLQKRRDQHMKEEHRKDLKKDIEVKTVEVVEVVDVKEWKGEQVCGNIT